MERWQHVWRVGFAPILSTRALLALRDALLTDDPRLVQGTCTSPPAKANCLDWPVERACALGLCGWLGEGRETVGEVEEFFAKCCFEADERLGEPAACRWFLNWFDDTPRDVVRCSLLVEVLVILIERFGLQSVPEALIAKLRIVPLEEIYSAPVA